MPRTKVKTTEFDERAKEIIRTKTNQIMESICNLAEKMGVDPNSSSVMAAVDRFGGQDLAECWEDFLFEYNL